MTITYDEYVKQLKKKRYEKISNDSSPLTYERFVKQYFNMNDEEYSKWKKQQEIDEQVRNTAKQDFFYKVLHPEVDEEQNTWINKNAEGNFGQKALATTGDITLNLIRGVIDAGDFIGDLGSYAVAGVADLFGADNYAKTVREGAQINLSDLYLNRIDSEVDRFSILGEKTDSVISSVGQSYAGGKVGQTFLPNGGNLPIGKLNLPVTALATGASSSITEAYKNGANDKQALVKGITGGLIEAFSESIFGLFGQGGSEFEDMVTRTLTKKIENQVMRKIAKTGISALGEGLEEQISYTLNWIADNGQDVVFEALGMTPENKMGKEWSWQEFGESGLSGALAGGLGAGATNIGMNKTQNQIEQAIHDTQNNLGRTLTRQEQGIVSNNVASGNQIDSKKLADAIKTDEEVVKALVKERQKESKGKSYQEIRKEVIKDLEQGDIDINKINEIIGGKDYQTFQQYAQEIDELANRRKELKNVMDNAKEDSIEYKNAKVEYDALQEQINNYDAKTLKGNLQNLINDKVLQNGLISNSYRENAKRSVKYEADLSKYNDKEKAIVQKAIDSGVLNNTRRTHILVDMVAKLASDKGVDFDFTNNKNLEDSGFAIKGKVIDGYVTGNNIALNVESPKALNKIVGHEITHVLEGTELYDQLKTAIEKYAELKGEYETRLEETTKRYEKVKGADIKKEVVADLVGDYIFNDPKFVQQLSTEQPSLFKKIFNEIKYLCKVVTAGSQEAKQLEKVKKIFEDVYRENSKVSKDTKFSIEYLTNQEKTPFVWLDKDLSQMDAKQQQNYATDFIQSLAGQTLGTTDGDNVVILKEFVNIKNPKKNKLTSDELYYGPTQYSNVKGIKTGELKNKILSNIDETILTSEFYKWKPDVNNRHNDLSIDAFDTRKTLVYDGKNMYEIKLDVAIMNDGTKAVYDIKRIAKKNSNLQFLPQKKNSTYKMVISQPSSLGITSSVGDNITQTPNNVKSNAAPLIKAAKKNTKLSISEQLENQASKIATEDIETRNAMLENFKNYLEENDITNPTQQDIDNSLVDLLGYDNDMTPGETAKYEKLYNEVAKEYLDQQGVKHSVSEAPTKDTKGRSLTKGQQEFYKNNEIKDENGNLKVLYHGTPFGNFTTFKGKMFFFSEDYQFARDYADSKSFEQGLDGDTKVVEAYLKAEKVFDPSNPADIQTLSDALSDEIRYWGNNWNKETLLDRLQRRKTLEPKWKPEQIVDKKFGDYIGDDRNGYNTDMFVGVNENNEIVYIPQERGLQQLTAEEKAELEKKLMSGEEATYTTYETIYGELTEKQIQEKINELKQYAENYKKETGYDNDAVEDTVKRLNSELKWELGMTNHKLIPKTTTQENTELDDIDNWAYFETAFDSKSGKDIVDIIQELGYDAINIYEEGKSNYIVFKPNQIKSVDNTKPTDNPDIRYSISVSEANTGVDNQGRKVSKGMQNYMKDSKTTDENGNIVRVYHTTTAYHNQFNEFNPVGTPNYRFGDVVVNFYTDDKEMSGSYANGAYKMANTKKITSLNDVKQLLGDEYSYKNENGVYNIYNNNVDKINKMFDKWVVELTPTEQTMLKDTLTLTRSEVISKLNTEEYILYENVWDKLIDFFATDEFSQINKANLPKSVEKIIDDHIKGIKKQPIKSFNNLNDLYKNITELTSDYSKYQYEGYVNITNPYVIDAEGRNWNSVDKEIEASIEKEYNKIIENEELKKQLRDLYKESQKRYIDYTSSDNYKYDKYLVDKFNSLPNQVQEAMIMANLSNTKYTEFIKEWDDTLPTNDIEVEGFSYSELSIDDFARMAMDARENLNAYGNPGSYFENMYENYTGVLRYIDKSKLSTLAAIDFKEMGFGGIADLSPIDILGKRFTTNDIVKQVLDMNKNGANYDGVIIKNVEDYGGKTNTRKPNNLYITFNSNQFKSIDNEKPTDDPDWRYSITDRNVPITRTPGDIYGSDIKIQQDASIIRKVQRGQALNPNEISKLTPEDANTTPILPKVDRNKVGDGDSRFAKNIKNKTKMLSEEHREMLANEEEIAYYDKVTNKESLEEAYKRLENGSFETNKWFGKASENATAVDVAEGWILLKQYADNNDTDGMVEVAKKLRDMGTKAGQTVQAFNIMSRLTPEGMVKYAQSELMEAYDKMVQGQTKKWIDENKNNFDLQPDEVKFIMDTMKEVSMMEDGYDKRVKLAQIQKLMTDKLPPAKGAGIKSWMRISMLFNPKTQVRNVAGNAIIAPVNYFGDMFASGVDKIIGSVTGVRTTGRTKVGNYAKGFKEGLYQSYNDFKLGIDTRNLEGNRFEIGEGRSFKDKGLGKALNKVDSLLSFMLDAGDRGFYEAAFTNSINNQMVLNNTNEVTQEMIDIATQEALSRTWQDNNGYTRFVLNVRKGLNQINVRGYGLGDILIPFAKTPANLTKAIVDYSPVGLVTTMLDGVKLKNAIQTGQFTPQMQHKFVQELGKATAGTMLYVLGVALAKAGITSGESDEDKDVSNFLKNTLGISSYSIKIGDKTFTYDWAQPIAAPLTITSNIVNAKDNKEMALLEAIVGSMDSAGSTLLEQSFLQSINDVLNNYDGVVSGLITEVLELPSRAIPTLSKQIVDLTDNTQRQTFEKGQPIQSAINAAKAKIPGLSQKLAPQVDTLGREIQRYGGKNNAFNVFFNPANVNTENISEAAQEIYDVYTATGDKTVMPRVVDYTYKNKDGVTIPLTTHQRAKLQKETGRVVEENVLELMDNEIYQNLSDVDKAAMLTDIVNYSYNIAKHEVLDTEVSQTYSGAYTYSKIGDISNYYLFKLPEFSADIDKDGNSISGSKKKKVVNYINSLPNLNKTEKAILVLFSGSSLKGTIYEGYDTSIVNYVRSKNLTEEEYAQVFTKLGYKYKNGRVYKK